jgi:hypothetical protein
MKSPIILSASVILLLLLSFLAVLGNVQLASAADDFELRATQVSIDTIQPGKTNYVSGWENKLRSLGVNALRLQTGGEGVTLGLNPTTYPGTWDSNLEWLLTHITGLDRNGAGTSTGFKCWFQSLGDPWGGLFGINDLNQNFPPMSISAAKAIIDKLAGANSLNHNFITDSRIMFWAVGNECKVSSGGTPNSLYYFLIDLMDYIRSKGGVVIANSPEVDDSLYAFAGSVPLFQGHADYMELHAYHLWELIHDYALGVPSFGCDYRWDDWQAALQTYLSTQIANRGSFSVNRLILGEFGIWTGFSSEYGVTTLATFTDQNRVDYYNHYFAALKAVGFLNAAFFSATWAGPYYMIDGDGALLSGCEVIAANFAGNSPFPTANPTPAPTPGGGGGGGGEDSTPAPTIQPTPTLKPDPGLSWTSDSVFIGGFGLIGSVSMLPLLGLVAPVGRVLKNHSLHRMFRHRRRYRRPRRIRRIRRR